MMRVTLFGTRGSVPTPGPETTRYGGNTPAVEVRAKDGTVLALDAGTGIRRLGAQVPTATARIDILLTHLHMDHIQGLGFFGPALQPGDRRPHLGTRQQYTFPRGPPVALPLPAPVSGAPSRTAQGDLSPGAAAAFRHRSVPHPHVACLSPGADGGLSH
jgi:glyoxylase-like metal-dependent hydrolase (beta-lactamase superfamily II)